MKSATLLEFGVGRYCPVTNHYSCDDGTYLLITVNQLQIENVAKRLGLAASGPIRKSQVRGQNTDVFLSNERGDVIDADDNPANGMTPVHVYPPGTSHEEALAAMGYEINESVQSDQ